MAFASAAGTEPGLSARQELITRLSRALNPHCVAAAVFVSAVELVTVLSTVPLFALWVVLVFCCVFCCVLCVCCAPAVASELLPSRRRITGASLSLGKLRA